MLTLNKNVSALLVAAMLLAPRPLLLAQSLQQQNTEILNELKAIRQLLEKLAGPLGGAVAAPTPTFAPAAPVSDKVTMPTVAGIVLGKADAPLTMVEFTDLQCPFCRQFHVAAFEQIKRDYIDTGKLRYISRDLPLESLHPLAMTAARASRCAGDQGRFWEMRHSILVNNAQLTPASFDTFARDLKLNAAPFKSCAGDGTKYQTEIQADMAAAAAVGITATPSFVIGKTSGAGLDGIRFIGAQPFAAFEIKLKELLSAP